MRLYADVPYDYFRTAGNLIFTAGACPLDESGQIVASGDFETQARWAVENLIRMLTAAGTDAGALLKTTIYVATSDRSDLVRVWEVMAPRLGRAPSTLLGVSALGYRDQVVEIEAVARAKD
jgi:enamine deaminase RidA (YjgF/YER057c/UK114 family)